MLHIPSMIVYGFLSFILAFFNKALFEIANFRNSLFVIFCQLSFIILTFHILSYFRRMTIPIITKTEISTLLIPSIFFCLSTVLSLQALMKLNVAVYVIIKVRFNYPLKSIMTIFLILFIHFLALYTSINIYSLSNRIKKETVEFQCRTLCINNYSWCCDNINWRFIISF